MYMLEVSGHLLYWVVWPSVLVSVNAWCDVVTVAH